MNLTDKQKYEAYKKISAARNSGKSQIVAVKKLFKKVSMVEAKTIVKQINSVSYIDLAKNAGKYHELQTVSHSSAFRTRKI